MDKKYSIIMLAFLFILFLIDPALAAEEEQQSPLFQDLINKGAQIFMGMRDIIFVVSGFGIIGVAIGGFFGAINWKWLGAIIIGLMVIASAAAFVEYITGEEIDEIRDTLT